MTQFLKTLPLLAVLIAAPAFAAQPDPHAGHHPEADAKGVAAAPKPVAAAPKAKPKAKSNAKAAMAGCPMMDGKMMGGAGAMAGKGADGKMMMDPKDMHCMAAPAPAAPAGADASHDHDHPLPAQK